MAEDQDLAAWVRLTLIPGIGGETQRRLLKTFGLPAAVFAAGPATLRAAVDIPAAEAIAGHDPGAAVDAALAWACEPGNRILTLGDPDYPPALLRLADPPLLLYVKGRVELLNRPALAVVGSRNATKQGEANAAAFAAALAQAGLVVVSGLALGVDAAAHRGALDADGATVAVVGTGADRIYPPKNEALARAIAERGAVVSEFPLGTPPLAANFPRRNRLIAGLAQGCLVVEAAERSGSLITARLAAEVGAEVFAIPGSIHAPLAKGSHKLIKQGAKLVESAEDILEELRWGAATVPLPLAADDDPILHVLGHDPCDLDALAERTGLSAEALLARLLPLELDGRIAQLPGGRYQRIN